MIERFAVAGVQRRSGTPDEDRIGDDALKVGRRGEDLREQRRFATSRALGRNVRLSDQITL